ncbi:MAG: sugar phosphate nucleotidyltransferase [Armatimonadota bacterium]|nr:sugar phosphate nucleotidyltransferase [Armatimonadota bacterium]MDR7451995.1 sugar phosphate nucleotidyltransferase [Armatimonadota bacterium]MDR7467886.1 sugar phosphate nucleotidyltransferase [Armatimonadota bacterium]MDR7494261.1 sugar phosphate nucleotidyltransferase [Armatimonadota bacterium]MDR7500042.1 sugar phosphate nucleotidyltransferase [Armatimonadota bacterium]
MKAIIPVAGYGTRLRPHTHTQPKALMHVAGKPILAHIIDELAAVGVDEIVLVVGYLGEKIEAFARQRYGHLRLHFVVQEEPLGNGHAVYVARAHLDGSPVVLIFGDTIIKGDLAGLLARRESLAGVKPVDDPRRLGVVEVDARGRIRRFIEKPEHPTSNLALIGVYHIWNSAALAAALERLVREDRRVRGEFWLADGLQLMVDAGEPMGTFPIDHWYDCGTAESLLAANHELLEMVPPHPPRAADATVVIPPSYVSPAAEISGSVIGPYVSIAEGARVTHSVIRDSIVNAYAEVADALLERSIVGERAVVKGRPARVNVGDSSAIELT